MITKFSTTAAEPEFSFLNLDSKQHETPKIEYQDSEFHLPPSRDNECYGFHLYARKEGRRIGMLMTHGSSGYGWDYRFRVKK